MRADHYYVLAYDGFGNTVELGSAKSITPELEEVFNTALSSRKWTRVHIVRCEAWGRPG